MKQGDRIVFALWPCVAVFVGLWRYESAWMAIGLYHMGIAVGVVWDRQVLREPRNGWRRLPVFGGLLIGVLTVPTVLMCLPLLVGMNPEETGIVLADKLAQTGLSGAGYWIFFAYFVTIHPVLEELGWRGVLGSRRKGLHLLDLEFAIYHLIVLNFFFPRAWALLVVTLIVLTGSAWLWRQMMTKFGGLGSVIVFHAAA
ncbi:MAG: hypothetical protein AAGH89_01800, partial [Verrucomicrobiota bacterium]